VYCWTIRSPSYYQALAELDLLDINEREHTIFDAKLRKILIS
jgi:hypothetical protein